MIDVEGDYHGTRLLDRLSRERAFPFKMCGFSVNGYTNAAEHRYTFRTNSKKYVSSR
jgi:hypothetical protein